MSNFIFTASIGECYDIAVENILPNGVSIFNAQNAFLAYESLNINVNKLQQYLKETVGIAHEIKVKEIDNRAQLFRPYNSGYSSENLRSFKASIMISFAVEIDSRLVENAQYKFSEFKNKFTNIAVIKEYINRTDKSAKVIKTACNYPRPRFNSDS